eukprot:TRINITY_DN1142_c0_g1_i5.p1 TRINITY_DN1142_c0_g1~~TRINITY_DN1142_c0_g1_i5.p1  ORF type:complete len:253 (-),score=61.58 TRINITY_DN1142_c0_g1_i5:24-782(-)
MDELGYDSVYLKRPSLNISSWSGRFKHDGCGIFFLKSKFKLLEEISWIYEDIHDRVALVAALKIIETEQIIVVGNTHLYWNSKKLEDQFKELQEFETAVDTMIDLVTEKYHIDAVPVILGGDFNNGPNSEIYHYMQEEFGNDNVSLRSAFDIYKQFNNESRIIQSQDYGPEYEPGHTTVTSRRCWTIDYIWYDSNTTTVKSLLKIPEEEELRNENINWYEGKDIQEDLQKTGIPNSVWGSDHVPIVAIFELK